jgi:hypothetical protein
MTLGSNTNLPITTIRDMQPENALCMQTIDSPRIVRFRVSWHDCHTALIRDGQRLRVDDCGRLIGRL